MGRAPCCSKVGLHKGPWTSREDTLLTRYIEAHGEGHWRSMPKRAGLLRCGKSCRLRWMNYLRPDIKRGNITPDEDDLIIKLHALLGNRWSLIAGRLPGRTDNEIKNYWNTHLSKKFTRIQETQPNTHKKLSKPAKEVKRQKNMKMKNNRQKNKRKEMVEPEEKPKIHVPKPSRVTSFAIPKSVSFEYCNTASGSFCFGKEVGFGTEGLDDPWCGLKNCDTGFGFLVGGDQDHDVVNCSNSDHLPTADDNTLEKLYDEYFQLLNTEEDQVLLDSFAESLLV